MIKFIGKPVDSPAKKEASKLHIRSGYASTEFAAHALSCSTRRIRKMLETGKLQGFKDERNIWQVKYPLVFTSGTRGPLNRFLSSRAQRNTLIR